MVFEMDAWLRRPVAADHEIPALVVDRLLVQDKGVVIAAYIDLAVGHSFPQTPSVVLDNSHWALEHHSGGSPSLDGLAHRRTPVAGVEEPGEIHVNSVIAASCCDLKLTMGWKRRSSFGTCRAVHYQRCWRTQHPADSGWDRDSLAGAAAAALLEGHIGNPTWRRI